MIGKLLADETSSSTSSADYTCNKPTKDSCEFPIKAGMKLDAIAKILKLEGTYTHSVGMKVKFTNATQLYSKGGTYLCKETITCNDLLNKL